MMNRIKWVVGASALTLASGAGAAGTGVQAEPDWTLPIHDNQVFGQVLFDRMEYQRDGDNELALWDAQAWIGKDRNRLWVETEGVVSWTRPIVVLSRRHVKRISG